MCVLTSVPGLPCFQHSSPPHNYSCIIKCVNREGLGPRLCVFYQAPAEAIETSWVFFAPIYRWFPYGVLYCYMHITCMFMCYGQCKLLMYMYYAGSICGATSTRAFHRSPYIQLRRHSHCNILFGKRIVWRRASVSITALWCRVCS